MNEDSQSAVYNFDINIGNKLVAVEVNLKEEELQTSEPPYFLIKRIASTGVVEIEFSERFFPVTNLTLID